LYPLFLDFIINKNSFLSLIFGNGAYGSMHYIGRMAHNDWLQIIVDLGIIGAVVYLFYWINLIRTYYVYRKKTVIIESSVLSIGSFIILYLVRSVFSMSILTCRFMLHQ
jgi:O-antigen ligase